MRPSHLCFVILLVVACATVSAFAATADVDSLPSHDRETEETPADQAGPFLSPPMIWMGGTLFMLPLVWLIGRRLNQSDDS